MVYITIIHYSMSKTLVPAFPARQPMTASSAADTSADRATDGETAACCFHFFDKWHPNLARSLSHVVSDSVNEDQRRGSSFAGLGAGEWGRSVPNQ